MAFFDFLKDAESEKKAIGKGFKFLSRLVPGVSTAEAQKDFLKRKQEETLKDPRVRKAVESNPELSKSVQEFNQKADADPVTQLRDFTVGAARSIARTPETVVRSGIQAGRKLGRNISGVDGATEFDMSSTDSGTGQINDPVREFLYGKERVETYQKRTEGNKQVIEGSRFRGQAAPLSFLALGGTLAGDLTFTGGAKKEAGEKFVGELAKEVTETGIQNAAKKYGVEIGKTTSKALTQTKDPNIVRNLLKKDSPAFMSDDLVHTTHADNARGIIDDGKIIQQKVDGGPTGVYVGTKDWADKFTYPENSNVQFVFNSDIGTGKSVKYLGDEAVIGRDVPVTPKTVKEVRVGNNALAEEFANKGFNVSVDPILDTTPRAASSIPTAQADEIVDSYAQYLKSYEDGATGGQMIPDGQGGYLRTTEHSPFYRSYYAANKRKPSLAAYKEHALKELQSGRADSAFQPYYDDAVNPEVDSLLSTQPGRELTDVEQADLAAKQLSEDAVQQPSGPVYTKPVVEETGPKRQRGFIDTVKKAETSQPEAKQAAEAVVPQQYNQRQNKDLLTQAQKLVDDDYDAAVARVKSNVTDVDRLDEDVAIGQVLVQKALKENRVEEATELIDIIDKRGRATGRGSQALAIWGRLTPEGILKIANQKVRKAREAIKGGKKEFDAGKLAEDLKGEVEGAVRIDKGDVEETLKQIARDVDAEEKSVAEQVAGRVSKAVTPQKKKKIDTLVEELSKKIKQEQLAPLPKAQKKSPTEVLKEVFSREKEAAEAYPEVKGILKERFGDNPEVLKALDKFFKSDLGLPPASSTINSAIKEQLLKKGAKVREIIYKSWDNQKQSVDEIADALTKEGFEPKQAKSLADEVVLRLNKQLGEAKGTVLRQMMEGVPKKAQPTFLQKIEKLSNLGALDDADYITLARDRLKLPNLTPEITKDISAMSQKLQSLPDGPEKNELINDIMNRINDAIPVTGGEKFEAYRYQNILSGPRSQARNSVSNLFNTMITRPATMAVKATSDLANSVIKGTERTAYFKDVPEYYRGMVNSTADAVEAMKGAWQGKVITQNPDLANTRQYRLNQLPKKYTVITRFMEAQDRFFQTLIASGEYAAQKSKGVADDIARDEAERVAKYSLFRAPTDSKNLSGQGALLSKVDQFTEAMQKTMVKVPALRWFAPFVATPMNITKQFIEFSPAGFTTLYKAGGDKKAEQAAKAIMGTTITAIAAKHALDGNTTWAVPQSEKEREAFYAAGKKPYSVKIGDKWVPMISFGPFAYALALPASIKDANDRAPIDASQMDKIAAVLSGQAKFFSGQTYVQGVSDFVDILSGNSQGNIQTALAGIASQVVPLEGIKRWTATTIDPVYRKKDTFLDSLRASTPIASKKLEPYTEPDTGEESKRNISDYVLPYSYGQAKGSEPEKKQKAAVADFYKTLSKTSKARSEANDKITAALKTGDSAEAKRIAQEYNQRYAKSFKGWTEKYGESASNKELLKEYKSRKITLTASKIKARRRTIKNNNKQRTIYQAVRGE